MGRREKGIHFKYLPQAYPRKPRHMMHHDCLEFLEPARVLQQDVSTQPSAKGNERLSS